MPVNYDLEGGELRLYNLQISDSGIYICQAKNNETGHIFTDNVVITVTREYWVSIPKYTYS